MPEEPKAFRDEQGTHAGPGSDLPRKVGMDAYGYSVVGIGASAGGLHAVQGLLSAMPHDTGLVLVVVMHLSAQHESHMAELLQPHSVMPVIQVNQRTRMQPDHVYVIPPAKKLLVSDGYLDLATRPDSRVADLQIDTFFRSLAIEHGDGAAVILSGSGSDGSGGIQKIKEQGGLIFAQSPAEAEFDGMPTSAIATGLVDVVGPVAQLAAEIVAAKRTLSALDIKDVSQELPASYRKVLDRILDFMHQDWRHDFSKYKEATVRRRIARRMQLAKITEISSYLDYLRRNPLEVEGLFKDLLINVTEFFRDSEAWDYLAHEVVPAMFSQKSTNDIVRAWVAGCATGEEVYGLAMLLVEHVESIPNPLRLQLFASDLSESALEYARAGIYPQAIAAHVPADKLARFFEQDGSHYRVRKDLRELVLFSKHNLLQDPPFSQLDLIVCRNVFIYLQRPAQQHCFKSFHYGLRPDGYLFLGSAESADDAGQLFDPVHKHYRIYRRTRTTRHKRIPPAVSSTTRSVGRTEELGVVDRETSPAAEHMRGLETVGLPSLLISEDHVVLHYSETAGRYLQHPGGVPTGDVVRLVRPELQGELLSVLQLAFAEAKPIRTRPIPVRFDTSSHLVTVLVRLIPDQRQALILFWEEESDEGEEPVQDDQGTTGTRQQLELELRSTEQRLTAIHEQYEATVEKLRAANQELQSTNEEYRATLKELETGKEELQSMNEELHTVNQELNYKVDEVVNTHGDLKNLFESTGIATLFLDGQLRVRRYTPRVADIFNLMVIDIGRPIEHLTRTIAYPELEADARAVLENFVPMERQIRDNNDKWYSCIIRPYRTVNEKVDGVVITFVDVTSHVAELAITKRIHEISIQLLHETDLDKLLDEILAAAVQVMRADMGNIQMLDSDSREIYLRSQLGFGPRFVEHFDRISCDADLCCSEAVRLGKRVVLSDISTSGLYDEPETMSVMQQAGVQAVQSTPLISRGGQTLGVISTHWRQQHGPAENDLRLFDLLARQAADLIERAQTEKTLQEWAERLEARVAERTQQVQALAAEILRIEQRVQQRIALALHDDLQQQLYGARMHLELLRQDLTAEQPVDVAQGLTYLDGMMETMIDLTRHLTRDLAPPTLHNNDLHESLQWLVQRNEEMYGLKVDLKMEDNPPVSNEVALVVYHCARELLFNVVKHAQVDRASIEVRQTGQSLHVVVRDEGAGFDVQSLGNRSALKSVGYGLVYLRERLTYHGADLEIESSPSHGTAASIILPLGD